MLSNSAAPIPSTRIAILNMLPLLPAYGIEPSIVFDPVRPSETPDLTAVIDDIVNANLDVVVLQKVRGASAETLVARLRERGIKTVFLVCDLVDPSMAEKTDASVVVTDFLRSLYPAQLQHKISVVHDGIEQAAMVARRENKGRGSRSHPLKAVLVTSAHLINLPVLSDLPSWLHVTIVGRYEHGVREKMRRARWDFASTDGIEAKLRLARFLMNRQIRCIPWDPVGVYTEMCNSDIGIIPIDTPEVAANPNVQPSWKVKSENRLTMKMSLGLPVVATPIPSYEPVISQGVNGFLARDVGAWATMLEALRDPALRSRMGDAAREHALQNYSQERQALRLAAVFRALFEEK